MRALAAWEPKGERTAEIPFVVARIVLQDFTGVPLLVDLAAMRSAVERLRRDPRVIEPLVPVDLVVDHSVQVDEWSSPDALRLNMEIEFQRNRERYQFLKWGMQAFHGFNVVPPGIGIVHQVNLEYLAQGVLRERRRLLSRHPGRHRLAHDHDQRPRHRRLGRRRHRGRGRHARPAGLLPHAGCRRRAPDRPARRRRHRDRPRARRHGDAAQGQGRRQVRRVLRRGRGVAARDRPRHDREHGARVRRDDGLLPGRRRVLQVPPGHRPHRRAGRRLSGLLQGAGHVRHPRAGDCDYTEVLELDLGRVRRASPARSGRRTASSCRT